MLKRSKKILLEGTLAEFKNYPRGAEGREYVLMNIEEKRPDGSYAFYEKDEKGDIIPVSYEGTEGYDATEFILFKDSEFERLILHNFDLNNSGRITKKEVEGIFTLDNILIGVSDITNLEDLKYFRNLRELKIASRNSSSSAGLNNLISINIPLKVSDILDITALPEKCSPISVAEYITVSLENTTFDSREKCNAVIITAEDTLFRGSANTVIPLSVAIIDEYAFLNCKKLTGINIPLNVLLIKKGAFRGCLNLETITFEGNTQLSEGTFMECESLKSINIPDINTVLPNLLFSKCVSLENIILSNNITRINGECFSGCLSLSSIYIPQSITFITNGAFQGCSELLEILVAEENEVYTSGDNSNAIINKTTNSLLLGCINTIIPLNIVSIEPFAFHSCKMLSIDIPESVTQIGDRAFANCTNLTSAILPSGITTLEWSLFSDCISLESIIIPDSVTLIKSGAFNNTGLSSLEIPRNVSNISADAFTNNNLNSIIVDANNSNYDSRDNCNGIVKTSTNTLIVGCKNTIIPSGVEELGVNAFSGCKGLLSITIPLGVSKISGSCFYGCNNLSSVTIPQSTVNINYTAFANCPNLTTISIDSTNTTYDSRDNCNAIIKTDTNELFIGCSNTVIPNSVTSISSNAFAGATFVSIEIPDSVTQIGYSCFLNCSNLTSLIIGLGIASIGASAFISSPITSIIIKATTPPSVDDTSFNANTFKDGILYVPTGCSELYKEASVWKKFYNIQEISVN